MQNRIFLFLKLVVILQRQSCHEKSFKGHRFVAHLEMSPKPVPKQKPPQLKALQIRTSRVVVS